MPLSPPKGKTPAVASVGVPRTVILGVVGYFVVAFVIIVALTVAGVWDQLGSLRYALAGLLGAVGAIVPGYFRYAAGEDWFKRGNGAWVDTTKLTQVTVEGNSVKLREGKRSVSITASILQAHPQLRVAVARGVLRSMDSGLTVPRDVDQVLDLAGAHRVT